jgi:hypothetical protein
VTRNSHEQEDPVHERRNCSTEGCPEPADVGYRYCYQCRGRTWNAMRSDHYLTPKPQPLRNYRSPDDREDTLETKFGPRDPFEYIDLEE